ncbi:MAG: hypothetical protein ACI30P_00030 [Muribaculaceae bacterium]
MTEKEIKELKDRDKDGLLIYECIANNAGQDDACLPELCKALAEVDLSGQFTASAARFLHAVDSTRYADLVRPLVSATIDLDRERKYLGDLFQCLYGPVEGLDVAAMSAADNNFRRMYKRLFADTAM